MYDVIMMDPPWNECGGGKIKRGADRHYPLEKTRDLPGVINGSGVFLPEENAHLYMWATKTFLPDALWLMKELGFDYKTFITWNKVKKPTRAWERSLAAVDPKASPEEVARLLPAFGMGQYFRGSVEILLFGVKGKGFALRSERRNLPDSFSAQLGRHSQKPEVARRLVEARSVHPDRETRRLEMFAREEQPGWDCWGNEVG